MTRCHHFHLDVRGHSVTVNVHSGRPGLIELLVDGKEIHRQPLHGPGHGPRTATGELPTDPPLPVTVHVVPGLPGLGTPRCTAVIDGAETPMAPRAF
ncbi:hypothetical protein [Streptomyces sp. NPDC058657]|uniref:hypothetical protein n=1 Tax=unclassified Streptomyces TaxID=2593676 RepID=UPI00364D416C